MNRDELKETKLFTGLRSDWQEDCLKHRGKVLTGNFGHWCPEWDELPIDETCFEWPCGCSVSDNHQSDDRARQSDDGETR